MQFRVLKVDDLPTNTQTSKPSTSPYPTEHILEFQMLLKFFRYLEGFKLRFADPNDNSATAAQVTYCSYLKVRLYFLAALLSTVC
jgi:hypothetical protein